MRITKNVICLAIKKETGYDVKIHKVADDYFYFYSDDEETDLMLNRLPSTSVYTNRLGCHSIERWVKYFKDILVQR